MFGLNAIAHYNGWAMAFVGALIVMSGLTVLSYIISLFPRLVRLLDKERKSAPPPESASPVDLCIPDRCPADINQAADLYRRFSGSLGDRFNLADLHRLCLEKNLPHPHLTIKCLREAGLLVPQGEGLFAWED